MNHALSTPSIKTTPQLRIPGPQGLDLIKWNLRLMDKSLDTLIELKRIYGRTFQLSWPRKTVVITQPADIKRVLKDNHQNYFKGLNYQEVKPILGKGLVTAEGEQWKRQRKLLAPEFHHKRLLEFYQIMTERTNQSLQKLTPGTHDLAEIFNTLTFEIACEAFFGLSLGQEAGKVRESIHVASEIAIRRVYSLFPVHRYLPLPSNAKFNQCMATLDGVVFKLIEDYKKNPEAHSTNVLSRLLGEMTKAENQFMTAELLRDEVMTLMLAGHETTANTLTWTLYLLSQNPKALHQLQDEINSTLGKRSPALEDLKQLPYLKMCIQESMRLLPAVPLVARRAQEPDELGGFTIPKDSNILISQWVVHRDEEYFENALQFNPERFASPTFPEYAYFPFAEGPRKCIGYEFAMMESSLILIRLLQKFNIKLADEFQPDVFTGITLFSKNGLKVELSV